MKEEVTFLTKRERQAMEIVRSRGQVTANEVPAKVLEDLEEKGQLTHTMENGQRVYRATQSGFDPLSFFRRAILFK